MDGDVQLLLPTRCGMSGMSGSGVIRLLMKTATRRVPAVHRAVRDARRHLQVERAARRWRVRAEQQPGRAGRGDTQRASCCVAGFVMLSVLFISSEASAVCAGSKAEAPREQASPQITLSRSFKAPCSPGWGSASSTP